MYLEIEALDYFRRFEGLEKLVQKTKGSRSGTKQTRNTGRNLEFEEFRSYAPGDDLRDLDWRKMARTGQLYIKNYGSDVSSTVHFLLDRSRSMDYPVINSKIETAKKIIALFSYLLLKQNHTIKLDTLSGSTQSPVSISINTLENSLSGIAPKDNLDILSWKRDEPLENIFLLTDLWYSLQEDRVVDHLLKNQVNILLILSNDEMELPFKGFTQFQDAETNTTSSVIPSSIRSEYQRLVQQKIDRFRSVWHKNRLVFGLIKTDLPYYVQLKKIIEEIR